MFNAICSLPGRKNIEIAKVKWMKLGKFKFYFFCYTLKYIKSQCTILLLLYYVNEKKTLYLEGSD